MIILIRLDRIAFAPELQGSLFGYDDGE